MARTHLYLLAEMMRVTLFRKNQEIDPIAVNSDAIKIWLSGLKAIEAAFFLYKI